MSADAGSRPADPYAATSAPRVDPLSYPGVRPPFAALIGAGDLWEIRDRDGAPFAWHADHPLRLGLARVLMSPAQCEALSLSKTAPPHLNSVLEEAYGVAVDARVPVLAIGSNAAPSQLRHKFQGLGTALAVPSIPARVHGVRAGFSAFASALGYVPATLYPEAGAVAELPVQLLDAQHLQIVDATEAPLYKRVWLEADIELASGERLPGAYAYVSSGGYLGESGRGWVMGVGGAPRPDDVDAARWFPDQAALLQRVLRAPGVAALLGDTPEEAVRARAGAERSGAALAAAGLVIADNPLFALPDEIGRAPRRYGALFTPAARRRDDGRVLAVAGRSHDLLDRRGRSVVRLGSEVDAMLGEPRHVEIVSAALADRVGDGAPRVVATVYREASSDAPDPDPQAIEVDHMLRMGLGIEAGEHIIVRPVEVERSRWPDVLLGPPNSLTLRVTMADPSSTERDVCLLTDLSLQLLGVSSGDYVVLEGAADERGRVRTMAVKAFALPDDVLAERRRVSNGTWGGRFPGVRETLGVWPDIPVVFIDATTRARLGVAGQQLGTIRARPARLHQFGAELREMMLLLAVALVGVLSIVQSWVIAVVLFGALVGTTLLLTLIKLRRRLSHRRQDGG